MYWVSEKWLYNNDSVPTKLIQMPVNDSINQTAGTAVTPVTLAKMNAVPSVMDLMAALQTAQNNRNSIVELPWKASNNPHNYIIKVTCSGDAEEPTWYLHLSEDDDQPVLWNYETQDATLIHALVTAECQRTTYTAPLEQEMGTGLAAEMQLPELAPGNVPYLPREHEQPLPTAPVKRTVNTSLEWNENYNTQDQNYTQPLNSANPLPQPSAAPMTNEETSRQSVATAPRPLPAPVEFDRSAVDSIYKSFTNPDTGFISHAAFLFFLVNEFNRFQKDPKPLSVVRFDLCIKPMNPEATITPMPQKTLQEAGKRIFSVMRPLDWAAHYEQEFAILLPFTSRVEAGQLAHRIFTALTQSPLVPGLDPKMLGIAMGVASMPEDCTHPGILIAAAQEAKTRARKAGVPVMLFSDGI